jgi:hypothetical protein
MSHKESDRTVSSAAGIGLKHEGKDQGERHSPSNGSLAKRFDRIEG